MVQNMTMTCPPGWVDTSMLIFRAEAPGASGVAANIVVTRDRVPVDLPPAARERMAQLLDRQVAEMKLKLAAFAEVSRHIDGTDDRMIGILKVDWVSGQSDLTQSLTFVDSGDGALLIATATAGRSEYAAVEPEFTNMLQSFQLR